MTPTVGFIEDIDDVGEWLTSIDATDLELELCRRSFAEFVQRFWPLVDSHPLDWGWPMQAMCDHLQAVSEHRIKNLAIAIPPRHGKSTISSVLWPAWEWVIRPETQFLTGSYAMDLAIRDAVRTRQLMQTQLYQRLIRMEWLPEHKRGKPWKVLRVCPEIRPDIAQDEAIDWNAIDWKDDPEWQGFSPWSFMGDQNLKSFYQNDKGGHRIATAVGARATGLGGDIVTVDDAHSAEDMLNEPKLQKAVEWWTRTMTTRRNHPEHSRRVAIGQRVAVQDVMGSCWERGYDYLCLSMVYEADHPTPTRSCIGFEDPRTEEGEVLMDGRWSPEAVQELISELGDLAAMAQLYQRPEMPGGNIIPVDRIQKAAYIPIPQECDQVLWSWDTRFSDSDSDAQKRKDLIEKQSWVVGILLHILDGKAYVADVKRGKWSVPETMEQIAIGHQQCPLARIVIEKKASGDPIAQMMRAYLPDIETVEPEGAKVDRASTALPFIGKGLLHVPSYDPPWLNAFMSELRRFPAKPDDQVDALTQGLKEARLTRGKGIVERIEAMFKKR